MMADSNSPTLKWSTAFIANRWCVEAFLELSIEISIGSWLVKFPYPGIVIYEYIDFGFDVGDGSTVMGHCFVWRVGIGGTDQTLDDFSHFCTIWIRHCVLKEIFPTFCLGLVDSLGRFTASIDPFLSFLMDCPTEAILSTDFGLHVLSHPRFRFLARFCFSNVHCRRRNENVIETRYTKR